MNKRRSEGRKRSGIYDVDASSRRHDELRRRFNPRWHHPIRFETMTPRRRRPRYGPVPAKPHPSQIYHWYTVEQALWIADRRGAL